MNIDIDHGSVNIGEETITFFQSGNEIFLRHSEMEAIIEAYAKYKTQKSVDSSVKQYLGRSKRVNPDAPGNTSYLYD